MLMLNILIHQREIQYTITRSKPALQTLRCKVRIVIAYATTYIEGWSKTSLQYFY